MCLEVFCEICHMVVTCHPQYLVLFAKEVTTEGEDREEEEEEEREKIDKNEQLHIIIQRFQVNCTHA